MLVELRLRIFQTFIITLIFSNNHDIAWSPTYLPLCLKVLNREFQEICHVRSDLQSILFMIFNPVRDELITEDVAGAKIWSYKQAADDKWTEIKHMANYKLVFKWEVWNFLIDYFYFKHNLIKKSILFLNIRLSAFLVLWNIVLREHCHQVIMKLI